ncbi:chaperone NapD [bacterium SCSIO 12643]|nr:chaperone NapD [bacterium SCSIO 12643]
MPIKSYLVHPMDGQKEQLIQKLEKIPFCELNPSTNEDIIVLVTDTSSIAEEKELEQKFEAISEIKNMALVSGFDI